jgi:hypothetical protein
MTRQETQTNNEPKAATDGKVGYKHPPVKSQFRKGQSGNPRGRHKGQRNLAAVLAEVLRQAVTVKQGGNSQRMSKGEALIQMLLTKAHKGDGRAIKAMFLLTEKIGRTENADQKLGGLGNYEFMLIPGIATPEEWQREIAARDQPRPFDKPAAGGPIAARSITRRPVNRTARSSLNPAPSVDQSDGETATPPKTAAVEAALLSVPTVARTGTYRKVNRRQPPSPNTVPDA